MLGVMTWYLDVPGVKAEQRRVTTGPTIDEVRRMLDATADDTEAETRDHAIVLMFFALGLRVSALCGLNLQETNLARGTTWIKGKGRREKELVPLPAPVVEAIRRYLKRRGTGPGPLFQTRGNRGKARDGRLETRSVLRIVRELGAVRPPRVVSRAAAYEHHDSDRERPTGRRRSRPNPALLTSPDTCDDADLPRRTPSGCDAAHDR